MTLKLYRYVLIDYEYVCFTTFKIMKKYLQWQSFLKVATVAITGKLFFHPIASGVAH